MTTSDDAITSFRFELRSPDQLHRLAQAPLPLGIAASVPRRTLHRDLYLDTADESLRRRGVLFRLRLGAGDEHELTLRIAGNGAPPVRVDALVRSADVSGALAEDNEATRRIRGLVNPALLATRLDLDVDRLTRTAHPDLLRRPRLALHYDQLTMRRGGTTHTFQRMCGHLRRGERLELDRLGRALEREHDLRVAPADPREHAEHLARWMTLEARRTKLSASDQAHLATLPATSGQAELLSPELSLLAFQRRTKATALVYHRRSG